jgi:hypothetical protein
MGLSLVQLHLVFVTLALGGDLNPIALYDPKGASLLCAAVDPIYPC